MADNRDNPKTVAELIAELRDMPQDAFVYTRGYEGGWEDCDSPLLSTMSRNAHDSWYYGRHGDDGGEPPTPAVTL